MKHPPSVAPSVSRETAERLALYVDLLKRWNRHINLVARGETADLESRHVADALQLLPLMGNAAGRGADLGTGGGIPGLVLAIASGVPFDLIEADKRKAAFLREAIRLTAAPATVWCERLETLAIPPVSLITARGFAPLSRLLALAERLLAPAGIFLLLKGRGVDQELTDANAAWNMRVERFPSQTEAGASILRISEVTRV